MRSNWRPRSHSWLTNLSCWTTCPKIGDQLTLFHFIRKALNFWERITVQFRLYLWHAKSDITGARSEKVSLTTTRCFLHVRKCLNQLRSLLSILRLYSFMSRRSWVTLSKAFARSRNAKSVATDKFLDLAKSWKVESNWVIVDLPCKKPNWFLCITFGLAKVTLAYRVQFFRWYPKRNYSWYNFISIIHKWYRW